MPFNRQMLTRPLPRLWMEWLAVLLVLGALVVWGSSAGALSRSNAWLQDHTLPLYSRPARSDIVLVLVDDQSIASIGRWPWRRVLHAQVLRNISQGRPAAIGLDFLLTEPDLDYPEDDALLAFILGSTENVVLPIAQLSAHSSLNNLNDLESFLPLSIFTDGAEVLGHSRIALDGGDGSGVRHFHPWERDDQERYWWPHLSIAMLCLNQPEHQWCTPHKDEHPQIYFARPKKDGSLFTGYSYLDVLQGRIPSSAFEGKYVIIGTSAAGLSITQSTPSAPQGSAMSNAELLAHILQTALEKQVSYDAPQWFNTALNLMWLLLGMLALWWLGPSAALISVLGLAALALGVSFAAPLILGWTLLPSAALLGLSGAYPLWSWRRQSAALHFLQKQMQALHTQGAGTVNKQVKNVNVGDFVQQHINTVEQALEQLQKLQTQREQAMRFISHDIRAPVSAILTAMELERHFGGDQQNQKDHSQPPSHPPSQLLERIERHAKNAMELADDFVHLARSTEQISTRRDILEIDTLIDEAIDECWANAQQKGIELMWMPKDEPSFVAGDPSQLRRALVNLLGNSIKYSPNNTEVSIEVVDEGSKWRVQIRDQGDGISPEALPTLFSPFARQQHHEAQGVKGIGLGLAYVRTVLEQHGGRVWAENHPQGGAVFILELDKASE